VAVSRRRSFVGREKEAVAMNPRFGLFSLVALAFLLTGCSSTRTVRVPVPPRVDLACYQTIGLVEFSSNGNGNAELEQLSTQRFLAAVQEAQPGTRVVELGSEAKALASVNRNSWDVAAIRAMKQAHGVDAILIGRIDVTKAKPQVSLSTMWKSVNLRADVDAALSARLFETDSGATAWTDSAKLTEEVANAGFNERGGGHVGVSDPNAAYANMVEYLVYEITDDFRAHYVLRRVPKEQLQTASVSGL
jgi:hypothetical protein